MAGVSSRIPRYSPTPRMLIQISMASVRNRPVSTNSLMSASLHVLAVHKRSHPNDRINAHNQRGDLMAEKPVKPTGRDRALTRRVVADALAARVPRHPVSDHRTRAVIERSAPAHRQLAATVGG